MKIISDHKKWVKNLIKKGINIQSGFLVNYQKQPGGGGLLFIESNSYSEALNVIKNDPMIVNNLVNWELYEWIDIANIEKQFNVDMLS